MKLTTPPPDAQAAFTEWWDSLPGTPEKFTMPISEVWLTAWAAATARAGEMADEMETTGDCPAGCRCMEMRKRIADAIRQAGA